MCKALFIFGENFKFSIMITLFSIGGIIATIIYLIVSFKYTIKEKIYFFIIALFLIFILSYIGKYFHINKEWWFKLLKLPISSFLALCVNYFFSIPFRFWIIANKNSKKAIDFFENENNWHISYQKNSLESITSKRAYTFYANTSFGSEKLYIAFIGSFDDEKVSMKKFMLSLKV